MQNFAVFWTTLSSRKRGNFYENISCIYITVCECVEYLFIFMEIKERKDFYTVYWVTLLYDLPDSNVVVQYKHRSGCLKNVIIPEIGSKMYDMIFQHNGTAN